MYQNCKQAVKYFQLYLMKNRDEPERKVRSHFAHLKITRALVPHGKTVSIHMVTESMKLQFMYHTVNTIS